MDARRQDILFGSINVIPQLLRFSRRRHAQMLPCRKSIGVFSPDGTTSGLHAYGCCRRLALLPRADQGDRSGRERCDGGVKNFRRKLQRRSADVGRRQDLLHLRSTGAYNLLRYDLGSKQTKHTSHHTNSMAYAGGSGRRIVALSRRSHSFLRSTAIRRACLTSGLARTRPRLKHRRSTRRERLDWSSSQLIRPPCPWHAAANCSWLIRATVNPRI